ncbi:hypothetical protein LB504_010362 [Fusarium proliferatum]|nr:hypothetical protein LB504_010362 [Fusarium proliferatum]
MSNQQTAVMDNYQILFKLGSWDIIIAMLLVMFIVQSKRRGGTSILAAEDAKHNTQQEKSDNPRDFIKAMNDEGKNCIVFYGSQTGTAESYAIQLAKEGKARFGLETMVANLEDYDYEMLDQLPNDKVVFFILATYGEGEPTDNAVDFYSFITNDNAAFSQGSSLTHFQYAAFGLGNKTYEHYNAIVRRVTAALDALGSSRIGPVGEGDDGSGTTEEDFLSWKQEMWNALASKMNLKEVEGVYEPRYIVVESDFLTLKSSEVYVGEPNAAHLTQGLGAQYGPYDSHNPYVARIDASRDLISTKERTRRCIHVEVDIKGSGLTYETGDHLAVWPSNADQEVDRLLRVLGLQEKRHHIIKVQAVDSLTKAPFPTPTTYDSMMRYYLEISGPVSRQMLADLVPFAPDEDVKKRISAISSDKELFHSESHLSNLARLLERVGNGNPWSKIPLSLLIEGLPKLQHRYYSISSSPLVQLDVMSITVAVQSELVQARQDEYHFCGVASSFLLAFHRNRIHEPQASNSSYDLTGPRRRFMGESIPIHIRHSSFRLPNDLSRPIIMIGPGTGVAPFRGFVQERAARRRNGNSIGQMVLFFGCRQKDEDFLYQEEWKAYESELEGKFKLITAFSREGAGKAYVQHRLKEAATEVYQLLEQDGHIYVCGDAARMAKDVGYTLAEIIAQGRGVGLTEAKAVLKDMRAENRYQEDVWA